MSLGQAADGSTALSLGADLTSKDGWALPAGYAGRFGEGARNHGFLLGGRLNFHCPRPIP